MLDRFIIICMIMVFSLSAVDGKIKTLSVKTAKKTLNLTLNPENTVGDVKAKMCANKDGLRNLVAIYELNMFGFKKKLLQDDIHITDLKNGKVGAYYAHEHNSLVDLDK